MDIYQNLSGNSNIIEYEIGDNFIVVYFRSGEFRHYLYNHQAPGISAVEHMKLLAKRGRGLNAYINTTIKKNFADKW